MRAERQRDRDSVRGGEGKRKGEEGRGRERMGEKGRGREREGEEERGRETDRGDMHKRVRTWTRAGEDEGDLNAVLREGYDGGRGDNRDSLCREGRRHRGA